MTGIRQRAIGVVLHEPMFAMQCADIRLANVRAQTTPLGTHT
jgi:hypothetical protein